MSIPAQEKYVVKASSDPAANTEITYTADEDLVVKSFSVQLVTDANVANRQVKLTFEDSSARVYLVLAAGGTQAASLTRQYSGRPGEYAAPAVADSLFVIPLPGGGVFLPKGGKIKTITTNIQATDNFGALTLFARRF